MSVSKRRCLHSPEAGSPHDTLPPSRSLEQHPHEPPAFFVYVYGRRVRAIPIVHIAEITMYIAATDATLPFNKGAGGGDILARLATTHPLHSDKQPIILRGTLTTASDLQPQLRCAITALHAPDVVGDATPTVANGGAP